MMLEQEIEKYLSGQTMCNCDNVSYCNIKNLILGFAEPREKRIAELEKENAELKAENEANENGAKKYAEYYFETNDQLTKAKEIIKELVRVEYADFTNGDYSNELSKVLEQAEQFLKE